MASADAETELSRRNWLPGQHGAAQRIRQAEMLTRANVTRSRSYGARIIMDEQEDPISAAISELRDAPEYRTFGVEMEFFGCTPQAVVREFTSRGLDCRYEGYNHQNRPHWKIVTDASVNRTGTGDARSGLELVSPILAGEEGFRQLQLACEALTAAGAKVDRTCGVHAHHGTDDLDAASIARIIANYAGGQQFIDSLLPPSRRSGRHNIYCQPYDARMVEEILAHSQRRHVSRQMMSHQGGTRYRNVNLESLSRHGTVEFRQHSGSTEYDKIANWVRFGQAIIAKSRETVVTALDLPTWLHEIGCDEALIASLIARAEQVARSEARRSERQMAGVR
jgi:hypothetical protein